jgi:hypothetical protein
MFYYSLNILFKTCIPLYSVGKSEREMCTGAATCVAGQRLTFNTSGVEVKREIVWIMPLHLPTTRPAVARSLSINAGDESNAIFAKVVKQYYNFFSYMFQVTMDFVGRTRFDNALVDGDWKRVQYERPDSWVPFT